MQSPEHAKIVDATGRRIIFGNQFRNAIGRRRNMFVGILDADQFWRTPRKIGHDAGFKIGDEAKDRIEIATRGSPFGIHMNGMAVHRPKINAIGRRRVRIDVFGDLAIRPFYWSKTEHGRAARQ